MPASAWLALLPLLCLPGPVTAGPRALPPATWLVLRHGWWVPTARTAARGLCPRDPVPHEPARMPPSDAGFGTAPVRFRADGVDGYDDAQVSPPRSLATRWRCSPPCPAAPDAPLESALATGLWLGDGLPQGADVEVLDARGWILLLFEAQRICAWLEGEESEWHAVCAGGGKVWRRTP